MEANTNRCNDAENQHETGQKLMLFMCIKQSTVKIYSENNNHPTFVLNAWQGAVSVMQTLTAHCFQLYVQGFRHPASELFQQIR